MQDFSEEAYKSREPTDVDVLGLFAASMPMHAKGKYCHGRQIHAQGLPHDSIVVAGLCKLAGLPASICSASRNSTTEGAPATGCRVARQAEE